MYSHSVLVKDPLSQSFDVPSSLSSPSSGRDPNKKKNVETFLDSQVKQTGNYHKGLHLLDTSLKRDSTASPTSCVTWYVSRVTPHPSSSFRSTSSTVYSVGLDSSRSLLFSSPLFRFPVYVNSSPSRVNPLSLLDPIDLILNSSLSTPTHRVLYYQTSVLGQSLPLDNSQDLGSYYTRYLQTCLFVFPTNPLCISPNREI